MTCEPIDGATIGGAAAGHRQPHGAAVTVWPIDGVEPRLAVAVSAPGGSACGDAAVVRATALPSTAGG